MTNIEGSESSTWSSIRRQNHAFEYITEHKKFSEFEGETIEIHDFEVRSSEKGEYLVIKVKHNGKFCTTARGGLICRMLKEAKEDHPTKFPVRVKVVKKTGQYGNYLDFEDSQ